MEPFYRGSFQADYHFMFLLLEAFGKFQGTACDFDASTCEIGETRNAIGQFPELSSHFLVLKRRLGHKAGLILRWSGNPLLKGSYPFLKAFFKGVPMLV